MCSAKLPLCRWRICTSPQQHWQDKTGAQRSGGRTLRPWPNLGVLPFGLFIASKWNGALLFCGRLIARSQTEDPPRAIEPSHLGSMQPCAVHLGATQARHTQISIAQVGLSQGRCAQSIVTTRPADPPGLRRVGRDEPARQPDLYKARATIHTVPDRRRPSLPCSGWSPAIGRRCRSGQVRSQPSAGVLWIGLGRGVHRVEATRQTAARRPHDRGIRPSPCRQRYNDRGDDRGCGRNDYGQPLHPVWLEAAPVGPTVPAVPLVPAVLRAVPDRRPAVGPLWTCPTRWPV